MKTKTILVLFITILVSACSGGTDEPVKFQPNFFISFDTGNVT